MATLRCWWKSSVLAFLMPLIDTTYQNFGISSCASIPYPFPTTTSANTWRRAQQLKQPQARLSTRNHSLLTLKVYQILSHMATRKLLGARPEGLPKTQPFLYGGGGSARRFSCIAPQCQCWQATSSSGPSLSCQWGSGLTSLCCTLLKKDKVVVCQTGTWRQELWSCIWLYGSRCQQKDISDTFLYVSQEYDKNTLPRETCPSSDTMWHITWSALVHVMISRLMASSHYLNQC